MLCYLVGSRELYFKALSYKAIASARMYIAVKFEVKKKKENIKCAHKKTLTTKLFSSA